MLLFIDEQNIVLHVNKRKTLIYMLTLDVSAESPLTEDGNASIVGVCEEKKVRVWESCCFKVDSECAMYIVQTVIGGALIAFSCIRLATETNADKSAPYWGLIGTMCGFIYMKRKKKR